MDIVMGSTWLQVEKVGKMCFLPYSSTSLLHQLTSSMTSHVNWLNTVLTGNLYTSTGQVSGMTCSMAATTNVATSLNLKRFMAWKGWIQKFVNSSMLSCSAWSIQAPTCPRPTSCCSPNLWFISGTKTKPRSSSALPVLLLLVWGKNRNLL